LHTGLAWEKIAELVSLPPYSKKENAGWKYSNRSILARKAEELPRAAVVNLADVEQQARVADPLFR
jgi:hypothetical protein